MDQVDVVSIGNFVIVIMGTSELRCFEIERCSFDERRTKPAMLSGNDKTYLIYITLYSFFP